MQYTSHDALESLLAILNDEKPRSPIMSVVNTITIDLIRDLLSMDSEDYVKIAEKLSNSESDVNNMLNFILCLVFNGHLSNPSGTLSDANCRARRLMMKIITKRPVIPTSLIVTGVRRPAERDYIGGGGFGYVYKGELEGTTVALKVLYKAHNNVAFCREALMWGTLKHKFVLPFLGIYEFENETVSRFFLVSPYMKNGTLAQWRKKLGGNPSITEIEKRIAEVAQGLEYIHSEGAVHGDLRGDNVLLDADFHVQITDFGLTRLSDATATRSGALHLNFAAPELFDGDNDDAAIRTKESDVYAFGCLYYEIHYNIMPFAGKTDLQIMMLISKGKCPPRGDKPPLNDRTWTLIQRCWRKASERPGMDDITEWMMARPSTSRMDKKRVDKAVAESKTSVEPSDSKEITPEKLRDALEQLKNEDSPKTPEEKEAYFMQQVSIGEQLVAQGLEFHLPAALSFFRALRVYPSPVELIMIYQKTVSEPVFKLIMELTNLNVKAQVEGYFNYFPPKWTNVSAVPRPSPGSQSTPRQVLVLNEDVKAGDIIYKEYPVVTTLDADLESADRYCSHCLRSLDASSVVRPGSSNPLGSSYCSHSCLAAAKNQYHALLFTLDAPLPPEIPQRAIPASALARKEAQSGFIDYIKKNGRAAPLLVAKLIARQVAIETNKMLQSVKSAVPGASSSQDTDAAKNDFTDAEGGEYLLADHDERLRFLELAADADGTKHLSQVLDTAIPGFEQFVTEERHVTLLGKMAYNAYGVYFDGGRDDKPQPTALPEDVEKSRTTVGTQRQVGSALYTLSSYLTHSCTPNARIAFPSGTAQLCLTAERDLNKGDELTIAFVDVTQHEGETGVECRRRRRIELARGWRFPCSCPRCEEEAPPAASASVPAGGSGPESVGVGVGAVKAADGEETGKKAEKEDAEEDVSPDLKDESKVDASLFRFEEAQRLDKDT